MKDLVFCFDLLPFADKCVSKQTVSHPITKT